MKITAIDTVVVHAEMRNWVFVKVSTDEGLVGWGEATVEWKTRAVVGCIEDYRTLLVGEDPRRVEHIWQMMYRQHFFRPGMVECSAISGIEHACWDIAGKALGVPVYQLLGGAVRDTVRLYDHLGGGEMSSVYHTLSAEEAREKTRESLELGFDAIKLEVVIPRTGRVDGIEALRHADSVMAAVRDEAGRRRRADGRHARPLLADDGGAVLHACWSRTAPGSSRSRARPSIPVRWPSWHAARPCRSRPASASARATRSASCSSWAPARCCSRTPCTAAASRSCAGSPRWARPITPRSPPTPRPGRSATPPRMHVAFATPNFLIQETWRADVPWRFDVLSQTLPFEGSTAQLPTAPGLGIDVDEKEAAKHPFQQEPLMRYFHPDGSVADW